MLNPTLDACRPYFYPQLICIISRGSLGNRNQITTPQVTLWQQDPEGKLSKHHEPQSLGYLTRVLLFTRLIIPIFFFFQLCNSDESIDQPLSLSFSMSAIMCIRKNTIARNSNLLISLLF